MIPNPYRAVADALRALPEERRLLVAGAKTYATFVDGKFVRCGCALGAIFPNAERLPHGRFGAYLITDEPANGYNGRYVEEFRAWAKARGIDADTAYRIMRLNDNTYINNHGAANEAHTMRARYIYVLARLDDWAADFDKEHPPC